MHGPSAAYPQGPQGGRSPQYGGLYRSDSGAQASSYPTTFRQHGNARPSVSQDEYVMISATSLCFAADLYFPLEMSCLVFRCRPRW